MTLVRDQQKGKNNNLWIFLCNFKLSYCPRGVVIELLEINGIDLVSETETGRERIV